MGPDIDWATVALWVTVVLVVASATIATGVAGQTNSRMWGEVTYQDGTAGGNVEVEVVNLDSGTVVNTTTTRSDGTWGPHYYQPGNYTVDVDRSGVEVYSTEVWLKQGETQKIDTSLDNVTGDLEGSVTDDDGDPVDGLDIEIRNVDAGTVERRVTTRNDGTYGPILVPANANYTVTVDNSEWTVTAPTVHLASDGTEQLDVDAERTVGDLTVAASDRDGSSIEGVTVEVIDADTGTVEATDDTAQDGTTDAFTLPPGSYTARIDEQGWESTAPTVRLAGGEFETISLSGRLTTGAIAGTVTDGAGEPVGGAAITVRNATSGVTVATATTDATGGWGPVGTSVGRLSVAASAEGYTDANRTVDVAAGTNESVSLTLRQRGGVRIQSSDTSLEDGTLTATMTLRNDGGISEEATVTMVVDDTTRAERSVSLSGGETRTVTLETDVAAKSGTYDVTIEAGNESISSAVTAAGTDTATASATATTADAGGTPTGTSDADGPGFGIAVALIAVVGLLATVRTRVR
jgi:PGF-CTERM protein